MGGIILLSFGALSLFGQLAGLAVGAARMPDNGAAAAGMLVGIALVVLLPIGLGILLLVTSKRKLPAPRGAESRGRQSRSA